MEPIPIHPFDLHDLILSMPDDCLDIIKIGKSKVTIEYGIPPYEVEEDIVEIKGVLYQQTTRIPFKSENPDFVAYKRAYGLVQKMDALSSGRIRE